MEIVFYKVPRKLNRMRLEGSFCIDITVYQGMQEHVGNRHQGVGRNMCM